jgi:hypothetical protein
MDSKHSTLPIESKAPQSTISGPVTFKFLNYDDQRNPLNDRAIRSHVMRQSWQQRKKQTLRKVVSGARILAPKDIHATGSIKADGVQAGDTYSTRSEMDPVPHVYILMPPSPAVSGKKDRSSAFNDRLSSDENDIESLLAGRDESSTLGVNMCRENQDRNSDTRCLDAPANPSPWNVLVSTMIMDTFATFPVEFLPGHQDLIQYCKFPVNHLISMFTTLNNSLALSKRAWSISQNKVRTLKI